MKPEAYSCTPMYRFTIIRKCDDSTCKLTSSRMLLRGHLISRVCPRIQVQVHNIQSYCCIVVNIVLLVQHQFNCAITNRNLSTNTVIKQLRRRFESRSGAVRNELPRYSNRDKCKVPSARSSTGLNDEQTKTQTLWYIIKQDSNNILFHRLQRQNLYMTFKRVPRW